VEPDRDGPRGSHTLTCGPQPDRKKEVQGNVLTAILVVIHVIASLTLILFILLHAGRGGGVSEMFGGGMQSQAMGSTVMEKNLDRITIITAIVFTGTTILLALRLD
jgi:preprotein translocase subunit SecG